MVGTAKGTFAKSHELLVSPKRWHPPGLPELPKFGIAERLLFDPGHHCLIFWQGRGQFNNIEDAFRPGRISDEAQESQAQTNSI
jgi:hypothetical protein